MAMALPRKQTVLFVGDLSSICTEQHIRELFEINGFMVVDIKMMGGKVTSNSFDYGFVELSSPEEAEIALTTLDGTFLCGRRLRVKWAAPNVKNKPNKGIINSVHVRFQSLQPGLAVNEETLLRVFEPFGVISDVSVKSCAMNPNNGLHDGYGFVHFPCSPEGVSVALKAVSALSENPIVDNVHYSCEMSKNLLKLLQVQSQKRSQDAYVALNSHMYPPAPRYTSQNFQNYAMPGQGYMPGSQPNYFRGNPNYRRPLDAPLDSGRHQLSEYGHLLGGGHLPTPPPATNARKPVYDPLLMQSHLRPELDEYSSGWSEPSLASSSLPYEPAYSGSVGNGLRISEQAYNIPVPPATAMSRYDSQSRYSDPRYASDLRLMEYRQRLSTSSSAPIASYSAGRRMPEPRDLRVPSSQPPIGAPISSPSLGYNFMQSSSPHSTSSMSTHSAASLSTSTFRHEQYNIEDFDYTYPVEDNETRVESAIADDSNKSVDELNELLSRHTIASTAPNRMF